MRITNAVQHTRVKRAEVIGRHEAQMFPKRWGGSKNTIPRTKIEDWVRAVSLGSELFKEISSFIKRSCRNNNIPTAEASPFR